MDNKFRWRNARGRYAVASLAALVAVAATVGSASASSSHLRARAAISNKELKTLREYVASQQVAPPWVAPGPKVNARAALKGKTIVTFPISSEIDACNLKGQQGYLDAEAKALGAHVIPLTTTAGPPSWIANLNTAITDKANAVVMLCGPSGAAIASQLQTMKAHKIPVVNGNYNQTGGSPGFPFTNLAAESGVDTQGGMRVDLADALVNLKGQPAHILFLNSPQVAQYAGATQALKAAIKQWCPKTCTIQKQEDFPTQDWSGPTETSAITSDLQADPKINTVIVTFDGMTDGIESTVTAAASSHPGLKMYAWGGGLAEIKAVQNGGTFIGDAGPNEKWDAYNQLDQVIRLMAHKRPAPVSKEVAPNMYFTKSNAASFSVGGKGTAYSDKAFDNGAFVSDFLTLWGVKK